MRAMLAVLISALTNLAGAVTTAPLDMRLSCPSDQVFLDRSAIAGQAFELIAISARPLKFGPDKAGKPQTGWVTDAKITSNKRVYEAHLIANGPEYAVIAYGDLKREGISGSVLTAVYQIDLASLKFKRTVTFFPSSKDVSSEGICKKL